MKASATILRFNMERTLAAVGLIVFASTVVVAQASPDVMKSVQPPAALAAKPIASPPATAKVDVAGGSIEIHYNSPQMRGRKIMGGLVPYDKIWRTGANPATTVITTVPLKFGSLLVPAGTHTLYTLPDADLWQLIINNQTGQWGLTYDPSKDLGRTAMQAKAMSAPQESMSISFENTTATSTEMHIRWETTDRYVVVTLP